MSSIGKAIGKVVGGITGSKDASKGAQQAAAIQAGASASAIEEQRRQFDKIVELMKPYVEGGTKALTAQQDLIGLSEDPEAQAKALLDLQQSPQYQTLLRTGEEAMLQNAAATGGLRGGNLQESLLRYRPELLSQLIESQYSKYGGLSQMGQAASGLQASMGQTSTSNIGNLLQQQGAALAGGQIAKGNEQRMVFGDLLNIAKVGAQFLPW